MVILLHHIQPWIQRSIAEAFDRIEKKISQQTERKIRAGHQRLDAFELRVLARLAPTIALTILQDVMASLRAYVDSILDVRVHETEDTPAKLAEHTVLSALFQNTVAPPLPLKVMCPQKGERPQNTK